MSRLASTFARARAQNRAAFVAYLCAGDPDFETSVAACRALLANGVDILELGVPVLGICYGLHFIVHHMGGKVLSAPKREYGHAEVQIEDSSTLLFAGLPHVLQVWMSHGDEASQLPSGFRRIAASANALAAIESVERRIWAVQFHP